MDANDSRPRAEATGHVESDAATGQRDIVLERRYDVPVEDVWAGFTERDRLAAWFGRYDGTPGPGATLSLAMTAEDGESVQDVRVLACEPPGFLEVERGGWRFVVRVRPDDAATLVEFRHRLAEQDDPAMFGPGWEYYLDRFEATIGLRGMPDFEGYDDAFREAYRLS